jgi:hypothetical protein
MIPTSRASMDGRRGRRDRAIIFVRKALATAGFAAILFVAGTALAGMGGGGMMGGGGGMMGGGGGMMGGGGGMMGGGGGMMGGGGGMMGTPMGSGPMTGRGMMGSPMAGATPCAPGTYGCGTNAGPNNGASNPANRGYRGAHRHGTYGHGGTRGQGGPNSGGMGGGTNSMGGGAR